MNAFMSRTLALSLALVVCLMPVYAHHGTEFLSKAVEMNTAEIDLAEMAIAKTHNPKIKEFAQMVLRDHTQALDKAKELLSARQAGGKIAKAQLTAEHKRTAERLGKLSPDEFDRAFMDTMVSNHKNGVRTFEAQTRVHGNASAKKQTANTTTRAKPSSTNTTTDDQKFSPEELSMDMDTVEFAKATLPTMKHHLQEAITIQKEMVRKN